MKRHSIIARLSAADTQQLALREPNSQVSTIRFIDGERRLGFGLGQMLEQLSDRGMYPSESAIDLAILAATVTAADTRISRRMASQDSWTREIDLYVPVEDPALWLDNASLLERTLKFLTGDGWRLFFRQRQAGLETLIDRPGELVGAPFTSVCLFSGGLDSFVGAIDLLEAGESPLFVSHYWDVSTSSQKPCADLIGTVYGDMAPRHVRARVGFPDDLVRGSEPEKTTRGRSFLFFSLAALAASAFDRDTAIYVPENGLISLNVPLDPLRLGAWSTRTTHPFYMVRWRELMDRLDITARLGNPYRFKTKGEMLVGCANSQFLRRHLSTTISCSSVTKARYKGLSLGHCGYCTPCLIRRAATHAAFGTDPTRYSIADLAAQPLNARMAEGEQVRSFQMMHRRLTEHPELARVLIHKTGPLSDYSEDEIAEYAGVFQRGIAEVGTIVDAVVVRPT
jgi:7-cyano-7-deazaguanine synthase in queuosine biosynthesis